MPTYIPTLPADPLTGAYPYYKCSTTQYHIGAGLEESTGAALSGDLNGVPSSCSESTLTGSANESGNSDGACTTASAARSCYDLTN